jgi:hypothetical protein
MTKLSSTPTIYDQLKFACHLSLKKAWKPIPLMNNINFFFMQNFSWDLVDIVYNAIGHCVNLQAITMELWQQIL